MARRRWHFFMTPLEHVSIRALDDRYRSWLTPMGRMVLWAGLAAVILTLGGLRPGLLATLGTLAWLGVAGTVLGFFFRPRKPADPRPAGPGTAHPRAARARGWPGRRPGRGWSGCAARW